MSIATKTASIDFNSRPSARGDLIVRGKQRRRHYFNSRPSARGDAAFRAIKKSTSISIHAPPRGATIVPSSTALGSVFQFTPLREGRRLEHARAVVVLIISIHAPPRGATVLRAVDAHGQVDFNSRPSARGDALLCRMRTNYILFQFTPLREGRQRCLSAIE